MKRVYIVHRWSGSPHDDWRPWLRTELLKMGFDVFLLSMPDTDEPDIEKWVRHIAVSVGVPDADTYFVGHSIGCQAILRYLERIDKKVGGAVFVAGWFDLKNLEDKETEEIARLWIEKPVSPEKIRENLPASVLIISDNDPYDAFEYNKTKFTEIGSEIVVLPDAGHLTEEDGYTELPEALDWLERIAGQSVQ